MSKRIFTVALPAWSLASASNLPAQDTRNSNTRQPTIEDRIDQLEQDEQNLKSQVNQLRNDVADLQDRMKRLEEGKQLPQAPPPAARSEKPGRHTNSAEAQTPDSGAQQSYDVFYQGLQSGGHWFNDTTYGEVWQPDVAASDGDWRPYSDGHWAYTDQGWTWISNEDFGWATYHYGRWAQRSDTGWVWIPGSRWAPAWVSLARK
jgi:outer membrane murein-binding lipoprotein Lpp